MNELKIPKLKKTKGLYIYCQKCKSKSTSKLNPTDRCNHPVKYVSFRSIFTIPGTKSIRSKVLNTEDINEAIKQTLEFEEYLRKSNYNPPKKIDIKQQNPLDLIGCISMYIDFIEDKNIYEHQMKYRSEEHIKSIIRYLREFILSLNKEVANIKGLLVKNINNNHVAIFHMHIINKKVANRTYNRMLDTVSEFFDYLIEFKSYELINYFRSSNIRRKPIVPKIDTITQNEFREMCNLIKPENSKQTLLTGENKYHYHDWLKEAFEIALLTGLRRDGLVYLRFSDIVEQDGKLIFIKTEDFKYNRRFNLIKEEEKKYNYAPIIFELGLVIQKIGYDKYKNTDRYLIAPDYSTRSRKTIKDDLSKAFTHFYSLLNTGRHLDFRHLRKTYITLLNNFTNGKADKITGHSGQQVILDHYQDPTVATEVIERFRMIS